MTGTAPGRCGYLSGAASATAPSRGAVRGRPSPDTQESSQRMKSVVFVAPFLAETTLRFVGAVAALDGVRTTLVSQDPGEKLPSDIADIR